jgi:methionyl-tRNA formyltransferase
MRIIFFGSPTEAATSLESLISAGHDIAAVYSRPDKRAGRGRTETPTPVKAFALERNLPVFTPKSLRNNAEEQSRLAEANADVFVVVAYGRILPAELLQIPAMGVVNVHPSLLPRYRGPSPVVKAILDGESQTGVTVMLLDEGMDTGPILAQSPPVQLVGDEKGAELQELLFKEGVAMLPGVLKGLEDGSITPTRQDDALATTTGLIERSDGEIDWLMPSEQIDRMVRAYDPWPGTFTSWNGKGLKILESKTTDETSTESVEPGRVVKADGRLLVGTGSDSLEISRVQLEGRQAVAADDFLRGQPELEGATLGS